MTAPGQPAPAASDGAIAAQSASAPGRRLPRAERREQILSAATRAFAGGGFAATGLDDIAAEAGISRVILYRHFESKNDLYRAVLDRACQRLAETVGTGDYHEGTLPSLLRAAGADPDAFRLLFRFAAREPEFRAFTDQLSADAVDITRQHLASMVPDPQWATWVSQLLPTVVIEAVIAWLDAGMPDPEHAAQRVATLVGGVIQAASQDRAELGET